MNESQRQKKEDEVDNQAQQEAAEGEGDEEIEGHLRRRWSFRDGFIVARSVYIVMEV